MEELGYEAGFVIPSSLAALNLLRFPMGCPFPEACTGLHRHDDFPEPASRVL
jgi:hypothetical protein